jgi:hypothetical protein
MTNELIDTARSAPSRNAACKTFAEKYGVSMDSVKSHLYRLIRKDPQLNRELPKGVEPEIEWLASNRERAEKVIRRYRAEFERLTAKLGATEGELQTVLRENTSLRAEIDRGQLTMIVLNALTEDHWVVPSDIDGTVRRVALEAGCSEKAAEAAVRYAVHNSKVYRTWAARVGEESEKARRLEAQVKWLRETSIGDVNAVYEEMNLLKSELEGRDGLIRGARKVSMVLLSMLAKRSDREQQVS